MSSKCAREECGKTVYPLEELNCLDKIWHKQCFKCTACGMTLNMKTYKGYEKKPYCESHYPKTVATPVVDTPEMRRVQETSKLQSQVKYHADYEKMKGHKSDVAVDFETERHKQNSKLSSDVTYHGEKEKKKEQEAHRPSDVVKKASAPPAKNSKKEDCSSDMTPSTPSLKSPSAISPHLQFCTPAIKAEEPKPEPVTDEPMNGGEEAISSSKTTEKSETASAPKKTKTVKKKAKVEDE